MTFSRNEGPEFSLIDEPWIPVIPVGSNAPRLVGLGELFRDSHRLGDVAEANPIVKAALLRFLTSMTYLLVDHATDGSRRGAQRWVERTALSADGIDDSLVDSWLETWRERLWLFHPRYPFCQDPRLAGDTSLKRALGPLAVAPFLPGNSSSSWGVNRGAADEVSLDEAGRLVLTNWFYAPAGNSSTRTCATSGASSKRVLSAAGANFPNLTHVFRTGPSLCQTLFGNLLTSHLVLSDEAAVPAFLRSTELTVRLESVPNLYGATLSAATTLIVDSGPGAPTLGEHFLRGSVLFDGRYDDAAKQLKELSLSVDPHTLFLSNPNNAANHPRKSVAGTLVALPRFCLDVARHLANGELEQPGVFGGRGFLLRDAAGYDLTFVQIIQGGTGSSRTIEGAEALRIASGAISPGAANAGSDDGSQHLDLEVVASLEPLLAPTDSALSALRSAIRRTIDPDSGNVPDGVLSSARDDLYGAVGGTVETLIHDISTGHQTAESRAARRREWSRTIIEIFDRHVGAYRLSQHSAQAYWQQRALLHAKLRKAFSL